MRFILRELGNGPVDLRDQLPVAVTALNSLPDGAREDEVWCAQLEHPLRYRDIDLATPGIDSQFIGENDDGPFLWVYVLALVAGPAGALRPGVQGAAADVGYVIDLSLADDAFLQPEKIRWVGAGLVDVESEDFNPAAVDSTPTAVPTPPSSPTGPGASGAPEPAPVPTSLVPGSGQVVESSRTTPPPAAASQGLAAHIDDQIRSYLDKLAALAGTQFSDAIPRAIHLTVGQPLPDDTPAYLVDGHLLRYHSVHPKHGWYWRTTEDLDLLVYWILDDIVRSLAERWAQNAPAAVSMDRSQIDALLWIPYWLTMLGGLNTQWRENTRRFIDEAIRNSASAVGAPGPAVQSTRAPDVRLGEHAGRLTGSTRGLQDRDERRGTRGGMSDNRAMDSYAAPAHLDNFVRQPGQGGAASASYSWAARS